MNIKHIEYMCQALNLALKGKGMTSPNPIVGCVVVRGSKVISEGWHKRCGGDHAEVMALKKAGAKAKGATLYVTLEPCSHVGRTPPCVDRIISSGIKQVFIAMKDPNPVNNGKSIRKLQRSGIKVATGILDVQAKAINAPFIKWIKTKTPYVVAKSAQSLDGKIATSSGHSQWITSKGARDYAHVLRNDFDAILVGANTVIKDDPRLNAANKSKNITKIICDSSLRVSLNAKFFKPKASQVIVATTSKAKKAKVTSLENKGAQVILCPQKQGKVDLKVLLKELGKKDITSLLIEGGSQIVGDAYKNKLVDKALIFIAPKIIGDQNALSSICGVNVKNVDKSVQLKDVSVQRIGEDILVEGNVRSSDK